MKELNNITTITMNQIINLWNNDEYDEASKDKQLAKHARNAGVCFGKSTEYLRGVLQFNNPIDYMPDLHESCRKQSYLMSMCHVPFEHYLRLADMDTSNLIYRDKYKDALEHIWNTPDYRRNGFLICVWPAYKDDLHPNDRIDPHATAFIKKNGRGYFMGPNSGLYKCTTLDGFLQLFMAEFPHAGIKKTTPFTIGVCQAKANQKALSISSPNLVTCDTEEY